MVHKAAEDTVYSSNMTWRGSWAVDGYRNRIPASDLDSSAFVWSTERLATADLAPDAHVTATMGEVDGPGTLTMANSLLTAPGEGFDSTDPSGDAYTLGPGFLDAFSRWTFSEAGVYCVPLRFSTTLADGTPVSTDTTLTFAVGDGFDRSAVIPCSHEGGGGGGGGGEEPGPDEGVYVPNGSVNEAGAVVLNDGHVDVASVLSGSGDLLTRIKDDTTPGAPVHRVPEETVLQLLPESRTVVPSDERFSFLGPADTPLWSVDQRQQQGLLWPGWSTEGLPSGALRGDVDWRIEGFRGPGEFFLYRTGAFGEPEVLFDTSDGERLSFAIPEDTHAHGTWAFTEEGVYCLDTVRSAHLADPGEVSSHRSTLTIAVGATPVTDVDPADCLPEEEPGQAPDAPPAPTALSPENGAVVVEWEARGTTEAPRSPDTP
ncbi:choice-of-anchor M domain-containing protein [Nocardiopsis sp. ARC36]